ncbi:hypothetical protein SLA2020_354670 [Shorea laevis]
MRLRMKGAQLRLKLRGKELSLLLIFLVCTTILFWAWDKSPLLTSSLPPKSQFFQLSPDVIMMPSEERTHLTKNTSDFPLKDAIYKEANHLDEVTPEDHSKGSSYLVPVSSKKVFLDPEAKPPLRPLSPLVVSEQEAKHKHGLEDEKNGSAESELSLKDKEVTDNIISKESNLKQEDKRVENPACNYAKGKWVVDDRRPLYSGSKCKQWLAPMWACRLTQRQDFAFEKLRWQPRDCQLEEFEGSKFLERMQDKTLAFVGDSLGRQQFLSLMCMITGGKKRTDVRDVGQEYGFIVGPGSKRPNGWAYRFPSTNSTILFYWSSCLCDLEPLNVTDPLTEYAMHLDRPPAFLHQFLHKIDVLVLNTGHHWNRGKLRGNRWVMYVGGVPNTNRKVAGMGGAKNFTVHSTIKWVNSQLPKHPRLKAFYRSISPRHFMNGDWNTGGSCDSTTPMSIGKEVLQEESSDGVAASAVRGTGVNLLDITALSQVRDEGHISRFSITATPGVQDCLHWCLPGVPDTWNELLFAQI